MSALEIVDFHNHFIPPGFEPTSSSSFPADQRARWAALNVKLSDERLLLRDIETGDIGARVVNAPGALIADAEGNVPQDTIRALNDAVADLVARNPGRIVGLATIDAYLGDVAAREAERAVRENGLRGLFVDSAKGDLLIDAPQARPTLETAARLGVPVFVHPVNPRPLTQQLAPYGRLGTLLARGTINSAALVALIESGALESLPDLRIVVTALAFGGLALGASFADHSGAGEGLNEILRRQVYIDTMGFHPALIRAAVDIVGASNVVAGSDFPIVNDGPIRATLEKALAAAGLADSERQAVAAANTRRLLGLGAAAHTV